MSCITPNNTEQKRSEVNTVNIISPYHNEVERFDNAESFPELELVVAGLEKPLQLHKIFLAKVSGWIKPMLKGKGEQRVDWPFDTSKQTDREALVKVLRFCYGETLSVGTKNGECIVVIATLSRLQVSCLDEVVPKLSDFVLEEARKDVSIGAELLKMCIHYEECCKKGICTLNKELAKIVLTKENMVEHFREVVDECLMTLPPEYLDQVQCGDPHTRCSEFALRMKYVRWHSKEMSRDEMQRILYVCDWSTLNSQEFRELRLADLMNKDELLEAHEKALEYLEIENERATEMGKRIKREMEEKVDKIEKERAKEMKRTEQEQSDWHNKIQALELFVKGICLW